MAESNLTAGSSKQPASEKETDKRDVAVSVEDNARGLVRDAITNINITLQYQVSFGVALLGLCITALKLFPPQLKQHVVTELIVCVSLPVILGMGVAFWAQDDRWFYKKKVVLKSAEIDTLHGLARTKSRLLNLAVLMHGLAIVLFSLIILIEYK